MCRSGGRQRCAVETCKLGLSEEKQDEKTQHHYVVAARLFISQHNQLMLRHSNSNQNPTEVPLRQFNHLFTVGIIKLPGRLHWRLL